MKLCVDCNRPFGDSHATRCVRCDYRRAEAQRAAAIARRPAMFIAELVDGTGRAVSVHRCSEYAGEYTLALKEYAEAAGLRFRRRKS